MPRRATRSAVGALPGAQYRAWASHSRPGDWSARGLRARCGAIADQLLARGDRTEEQIDALLPGGARHHEPGAGKWHLAYALLYGELRLADAQRERNDGPEADRALRQALADAAADVPEHVECGDGVRRGVYPKSWAALEELRSLDSAVGALTGVTAIASEAGLLPPEGAGVLHSLAVRAWLWAVTHPGPGLPWPESGDAPEPPAALGDLSPQDLLAIRAAYLRVNGTREAILARAFPRTRAGAASRLSFEGFLVSFAGSKHRDPLEILRQWSRARVVATAVSEAIAHEEAKARAEEEAARRAPPGRRPMVPQMAGDPLP